VAAVLKVVVGDLVAVLPAAVPPAVGS